MLIRGANFFRSSTQSLQSQPLLFPFKSVRRHRGTMNTRTRPLDFYAGPLVWVDCEMTGLNYRKDKIIEIAARIASLYNLACYSQFNLGPDHKWKPRHHG